MVSVSCFFLITRILNFHLLFLPSLLLYDLQGILHLLRISGSSSGWCFFKAFTSGLIEGTQHKEKDHPQSMARTGMDCGWTVWSFLWIMLRPSCWKRRYTRDVTRILVGVDKQNLLEVSIRTLHPAWHYFVPQENYYLRHSHAAFACLGLEIQFGGGFFSLWTAHILKMFVWLPLLAKHIM